MNILDLLKKYESNDSINYLIRVFGSEKFINDIFTNTQGIKYAIDNMNLDYKTYEIFHNVYIKIQNDNTINNTILNCLIILDSYYEGLNKSIVIAKEVKKNSIKLEHSDIVFKLDERIRGMYRIYNLPIDYKFYNTAIDVSNDIKEYSLNKQYNLESATDYKQGFNSVTVITPTQTISRFNDKSVNGLTGSGHHDPNFDQIIEAVYGRKILNSKTGQDILIKHVAQIGTNNQIEFKILIDMPYVINSTQFESLRNLNEEIKSIEAKTGIIFEINTSLTDYENREFIIPVENKANLDEVLNIVTIDDMKEEKYKEVCFLGYSNLENHYNDIKYTK